MALLKKLPQDFNISQVLEFAEQNRTILEVYTDTSGTTLNAEEIEELAKYRDFYKDIEYIAGLLHHEIKVDENDVRELDVKLSTVAEEAKRKRTTSSKVLLSLYYDFVDQYDHLREVLDFLLTKNQVCAMKKRRTVEDALIRNLENSLQPNSEDTDGKLTMDVECSETEMHKSGHRANTRNGIGSTLKLANAVAERVVLDSYTYHIPGDQLYRPVDELNRVRNSHFQHASRTKEHQQNKRKSADVEEFNVKQEKCVGVQTSPTIMSEAKATQTGMAEDQGTAGNTTRNVASVECSNNKGQQQLKREIFSFSDHENASNISQNFLLESTNIRLRKVTEGERRKMLQKLEQLGTSTFISSEDIQNINPKGRATEGVLAAKDIRCGDRYAGQTVGTESGYGKYALVKSAAVGRPDFENIRPSLTAFSQLRTLEESLKFFGLFPRLQELEKSLEDVRRRRKTAVDHEAECKQFDKDLQKLSREYHPDSVMKRAGSEEEVTSAKELQTALNATRTVLNTIHKIFLEDIDIDHRYEFFTKLDIGLLGNEDEVENHVYEILFKISLVSDIKQENIIAEIRRFLTAAQCCVESYLQGDDENFVKLRDTAFFHLRRCVAGYQKLHAELAEVEEECRSEKLHNIYPLLRRMRCDCSDHMKHLETVLDLTKLPFGEVFTLYKGSPTIDDYFILPFVCYTNVIMTCSLMFGSATRITSRAWYDISPFTSFLKKGHPSTEVSVTVRDNDKISNLHFLATHYNANNNNNNKQRKRYGKEQFGREQQASKEYVKEEFLVRLKDVQMELKNKFKIDDYVENGTIRHIMKELKICKEMKAEFEDKRREVESCIKEINGNNESMKKRLDKLLMNSQKVSSQLSECLADTKMFKDQIDNYTRGKKE